jgi:short-subunit dehydrogenase
MKSLKGKVAVVTGAGSGIGRALAQALAKEGSTLALADKNMDGLKETVSLLQGVEAQIWAMDVSDRKAVEHFASAVERKVGPADILINNAGVNAYGMAADTSYETLKWMMDVNFWGTVHNTQAFLPQLLGRPEASLVNVSSALGLIGFYGQSAYSASKFAVRGFTEALRQEMEETKVVVTLVFPGGVKTGIHKASRNEYHLTPQEKNQGREDMEAHLKSTPAQAAEKIVKGIKKGSQRVLIGLDAQLIDCLARFLPEHYDLYMEMAKKKDPFWSKIQKK